MPRALTVESTGDALRWMAANGTPKLTIIRRDSADRVAELALRLKSVTAVFDELDQLCEGKRWLSKAARQIVHYGRHDRIAMLGAFRRTQNVHEDLLSMADTTLIFKHSDAAPRDLDALSDRFGVDYAVAAQQLEPMQFLVWRDG